MKHIDDGTKAVMYILALMVAQYLFYLLLRYIDSLVVSSSFRMQ